MIGIASPKQRVIPFAIPAGFILAASLFLAFGAVLLGLNPGALAEARDPVTLTAAHLLILGFGVGVLMGAMHQLVPVVIEVQLPRPGWGYWTLGLWAGGLPFQLRGFLTGDPLLIAAGGALVLLGILVFAAHMLFAFRAAASWSPVHSGLAWVVAYLALTPTVGVLQALSMKFGSYDPDRIVVHAVVGLVGVFALAVFVVGHKLLAMFTLSHGGNDRVLGALLWAVNGGILATALDARAGAVLLAAAYLLAATDTALILRARTKRPLDVGVRHYLLALGFLGLSGLAFLSGHPMAGGAWFLLGFLAIVVTGMLYKILPFLTWVHRYSGKVGKGSKVPLLREMYPAWAPEAAMLLLAAGALLTPFTPLGVWLFAAGVVPFAYSILEVLNP
ncbi:MAG TPA: hypothetical protein VNT60_02505 [Deinococcales bacterium]|nr:hypothetical protein [Deinococcales bacterium]